MIKLLGGENSLKNIENIQCFKIKTLVSFVERLPSQSLVASWLHLLAQPPSHCLTVQAAGASETVQGIIILSFATTAWSKNPSSTGIASSHAQPTSRILVWSWIRSYAFLLFLYLGYQTQFYRPSDIESKVSSTAIGSLACLEFLRPPHAKQQPVSIDSCGRTCLDRKLLCLLALVMRPTPWAAEETLVACLRDRTFPPFRQR